jgi:hypothetical protein
MHRRLRWLLAGLVPAVLAVAPPPALAATGSTLAVPGSFPTIQAAIDAATTGDRVIVAPGTYQERIDFKGKAITVKSAKGRAATIIDAGGQGRAVTFTNGEGAGSVLRGFTIRNGTDANAPGLGGGGGIGIFFASPTIRDDLVTNNVACGDGAGIEVYFGSPAVLDNTITGNHVQGCTGSFGGGISVGGAASAQVIGNTISNNQGYWGGGIGLDAAGTPTIANNRIRGNTSIAEGAGIWSVNQSDASIVQNVIASNQSPTDGGGMWFLQPSGTQGPLLVNNTFAANVGARGAAVYANGFDATARFYNNILQASGSASTVECDTTYSATPPVFDHNDGFAGAGVAAFTGSCAAVVGTVGNISADPAFAGRTDYHLKAGSPAIDAGNSAAPALPATDFDGRPRIVNGAVDLGVYETP